MLQKVDLNTLPEYLFESNTELKKFIYSIDDDTLIKTKVSHQVQFENFVYCLAEHEPLTPEKLKLLLLSQPVEVNYLFSWAYAQFLIRSSSVAKFTSLSRILIDELIENNPESLHYYKSI